jgi:hypothetical protein
VRRRGSPEVFEQTSAWCSSPDPALRRLAANILGQLGPADVRPFAAVSTPLLERLLADADASVASCALIALGHGRHQHRDTAEPPIQPIQRVGRDRCTLPW